MRASLLAVVLLVGLFGLLPPAHAQYFSDVPEGSRLGRDVTDAACHQLMEGYPDGAFRPAQPLSRAGAVMVYARLLRVALKGFMVLPGKPETLQHFTDVPAKHWMRPAATYLAQEGMWPDAGSAFRPDAPVSRGELVVALYRLQHRGAVVAPEAAVDWHDERSLLPDGWRTALDAPVTRGDLARVLNDLLLYLTQHAETEGTVTAIEASQDGRRWVSLETEIGPCRLALPDMGVIIDGADAVTVGMRIHTLSDAVSGGGKIFYRIRQVTVLSAISASST